MDIDSKIDHALPFLYVAFSLWKDGKGAQSTNPVGRVYGG